VRVLLPSTSRSDGDDAPRPRPGNAARGVVARVPRLLRAVAVEIVLLALAFAGRGVLAWGFEAAGHRAAGSVLSSCGSSRPAAASFQRGFDGVEAAEIAAAGVYGLDGLEPASAATCRRSSSPASCRSRCSAGWERSISPRRS
jgi:hypothetical protein